MNRLLAFMMALIAAMALAGCSGGKGGGFPVGPLVPTGFGGPVGPADPVNGFPTFYTDPNGLTLALCKDPADPLCIADPVNQANAFSVLIGFGNEAFWWSANAKMPVNPSVACPACVNAILVMGLEAAFGGAGTPAQGQQTTFSRLRIRIDAPVAGLYIVTHPYGQVTYNVAVPGVMAINSEVGAPIIADTTNGLIGDTGCLAVLPCDFSLALGGATFPFLVWNPGVAPLAPAGYIGDPAVDHVVTGSPTGNNFFRVTGPPGSNLGGPGDDVIETNLFAVQGKVN